MENIVAYIDLLAFSNHVRENSGDALMAMNNYNTILSTKIRDELMNPVASYSPGLQEIAKMHSIDSFDYFLPFSDSVFLMSHDCNAFIKQLGSFVLQSFTITSHFYRHPIDPANPERGLINHISFDENGQVRVSKDTCNYYPALFRGGLSYGEAFPIELSSVIDNKSSISKVVTGAAVVEAVKLESGVKGPRLIFGENVYLQLDGDTRIYCRAIPENRNLYEILWPAMEYIKQNDIDQCAQEISKMYDLLVPAYNLWKAYNHTLYSAHYFNFIELIIASTIQLFDLKFGLKVHAKEVIKKWVTGNELKDKIQIEKY